MELSAKYIYEIYRCKSVSTAANKLFISQPALSASVKKAEKQLGFEIFDRSTSPFSLTPEGRLYIEALERIIAIEQETKRRISEVSGLKTGLLKVGTSGYASQFVFPKILGEFHGKHPDISIHLTSKPEDVIFTMFDKGELDMILTYTNDRKNCVYTPLITEHYLIAVPECIIESHELASVSLTRSEILSWNFDKSKCITDTSCFKSMNFISNFEGSHIYREMHTVLGRNGFMPRISDSSNALLYCYNLMLAGVGAMFATDFIVGSTKPQNNCYYFALSDKNAVRTLHLCRKKELNPVTERIALELEAIAQKLFPDKRFIFND